jgi:hypothetical protein
MTMTKKTLTRVQYDALARILALRKLAIDQGMSTRRAQNDLLQSLSSIDLAIVSEALANDPNPNSYTVAEER